MEEETKRTVGRRNKGVTLLAAALGLGIIAVGLWLLWRAGYDWRAVLEGTSPWVFFLAMATLPVCGFPISVCYVYAGMAFDPMTAVIACWAALAINMTLSYWLSRTILHGWVERVFAKRGWKIPELKGETVFRVTFLVRTVPGPPFFFQNLGLAVAGVPFGTYLWVSLLAQGSIAAGVIYCVGTLSRDPGSVGGIVAGVVVGVLLVFKGVKWILKQRRKAKERESLAST